MRLLNSASPLPGIHRGYQWREALPALPDRPGAYRWFYADVTAGGYSAVFIFMLGSLFSPRYSVGSRRGALPLQHSAVNFALYREGSRRHWVLSEYAQASVGQAGRELRIGRSRLVYTPEGSVCMEVDERCAPFGGQVRARLELEPEAPAADEVQLVPGVPHYWRALAPRAKARLEVDSLGVSAEGRGYHDSNHGAELLGTRLPGWHWARLHGPEETVVDYHLPGNVAPLRVTSGGGETRAERGPLLGDARRTSLTGWGLRVPQHLSAGSAMMAEPRLLESSPFYARLEARRGDVDVMGEVADFQRFHSPYIRWMAHFRTRVERRA
ncbi:carotenoid 1,2-hydratase [Melittangium boletus]|uniref:Hydroxyneurosporene synthase (CrtC) n=1 Tax=Melittangium boletus DSM 14713 TaxID=1294270 RepID=A0A250IGI1_9BACT|nr:carotenoid 1,2-hydratase [Melittangium boletus]ATB30875.1 hydroxyneurosporene synthase (CrtC) [Melittangium boletus DSM 14713]